MIRRSVLFALPLALLASSPDAARAKSPQPRAFEMIVSDSTGAPLPGALLIVKAPDGSTVGLSAAGVSDGEGKVTGTFPDSESLYTVDLSKDRFRPQRQTIDLASLKLKRNDTAIVRFTLDPVTAQDDYNTAIRAIQSKDMAAAEKSLRASILTDPTFAKGHEVLAMVLLDAKQYDDALTAANRALELDPTNASALRSRYDALDGLGRAEEAEAALAALAEKDKSSDVARLLYNAGAVAMNAKDHDKARAYLEKALAVDPNLYQAHAALAEVAIGEKQYDEAVKQLDLVLGLAPRNFKAMERKIEVLNAAGKSAEAEKVAKELAEKKAAG